MFIYRNTHKGTRCRVQRIILHGSNIMLQPEESPVIRALHTENLRSDYDKGEEICAATAPL